MLLYQELLLDEIYLKGETGITENCPLLHKDSRISIIICTQNVYTK